MSTLFRQGQFQPTHRGVFTIARSTSGGDFSLFEGNWLFDKPNIRGVVLRQKHSPGKDNSLSTFLLSAIGLTEKYVQKNQRGETQSLSFRNLARIAVVQDNDIIKDTSAILSGQVVSNTADYSVFKLLLTGVDDSELIAQAERKSEIAATRKSNSAKAEFIDELLEELSTKLNEVGINRNEAETQLSQLKSDSEAQQEILNQKQRELQSRIERRYEVVSQIARLSDRINEISSLLSRFNLLKEHYQIDLERLAAIEESGSLFVHLEKTPCPLCGALPDERHQEEVCDGDITSVVYAATAEIDKVEKLSIELDQTSSDLRIEAEILLAQKRQLEPEFQTINQEIQDITSPLRDAQNSFSEVVQQSSELQSVIDLFDRMGQLQERKMLLDLDVSEQINSISPQVDLSTSVLDDFAQKVRSILQAWNFPNSNLVHFDKKLKDIIIGGQSRISQGRGLGSIPIMRVE
jgi:chromosome segregation ATPase